jgi:hypothetical protein
MKTLGYIVSKRKVNDCVEFVSVVDDITKVPNRDFPVLVVGMEEAKRLAGDFNILEKKLGENLFWTFGKTEKRTDYESDLTKFYRYVIGKEIDKLEYYYVNPFKLSLSKAKTLLNVLKNNSTKFIFVDRRMVYIYYDNYVMGVSTQVLEYMGINRQKVLALVKSSHNSKICYNDSFLNANFRKIINDKKYATAYCYMLSMT